MAMWPKPCPQLYNSTAAFQVGAERDALRVLAKSNECLSHWHLRKFAVDVASPPKVPDLKASIAARALPAAIL